MDYSDRIGVNYWNRIVVTYSNRILVNYRNRIVLDYSEEGGDCGGWVVFSGLSQTRPGVCGQAVGYTGTTW